MQDMLADIEAESIRLRLVEDLQRLGCAKAFRRELAEFGIVDSAPVKIAGEIFVLVFK